MSRASIKLRDSGYFSIEPTAGGRTESSYDFIALNLGYERYTAGHLSRKELISMRDAINDYLRQEGDESAGDLFFEGAAKSSEPELELKFE